MLNLNYDKQNDVLYIGFENKHQSYGEEPFDGFVVMRDFFSDEITGVTVFDFLKKYENNEIPEYSLPIQINYKTDVIPSII